jgi:hypothetical protein
VEEFLEGDGFDGALGGEFLGERILQGGEFFVFVVAQRIGVLLYKCGELGTGKVLEQLIEEARDLYDWIALLWAAFGEAPAKEWLANDVAGNLAVQDFTVTPLTPTLSAGAGDTVQYVFSVAPVAGFSGTVNLVPASMQLNPNPPLDKPGSR